MRRLLLTALAFSSSALAASPLTYKVFSPDQQRADQPLPLSILLENTGTKPVQFNTALCPQVTITDAYRKKSFRSGVACTEPLMNVTIPAGRHYVYTIQTGIRLPSSQYNAVIVIRDAVNGHQASLKTGFSVMGPPQVAERIDLPPVMLSSERLTARIVTRNISSMVFSQDLRLCSSSFLIRDRRGRTVFETPATQACTADLRPTTLKPGEQHTESWLIGTRLAPGQYQIFHWGGSGTSTTSFEVVE